MRYSNRFLSLTLLSAAAVTMSGQCSKPEQSPVWNQAKAQFMCVAPATSNQAASEEAALPTGDKKYCSSARDNLLKVCPSADEGKACRNEAKAVFNTCYKSSKESGAQQTSTGPKTDSATCMTIFTQQQQACAARKMPAHSAGQMSAPDTCLQDAVAAQNKCLANSH
jgi:hypothetical protein